MSRYIPNLTKQGYIRDLLSNRVHFKGITDIILIYWHSEIPLEDARTYLNNYSAKIAGIHTRS